LSYNEARLRFWDAGPVAGGESPLAQQQYYSLEALSKRDAAPPTETSPPSPAAPSMPDGSQMPEEKRWDAAALPLMVKRKVAELRAA
jgi:hypothetical protein